jgi:hypothetical protein
VALFLSQAPQPSQEVLLLIADTLPPDEVPNEIGVDPWCIALNRLRGSVGELPVELSAYGLRRALGWRSGSVEALLLMTFEPLHEATAQQLMSEKAWRQLEGVLPWVPFAESWDRALRLRQAVAKKCVELPVQPNSFAGLVESKDLLVKLMDAIWNQWDGPRYLKGVDKRLRESLDAPKSRQQQLVSDYVKARSKFW